MLRNVYGEMILQKGSILYHTSSEIFNIKNETEKPFLFCTFHPSEWGSFDEYITPIFLKKDVSLLFMIQYINKKCIFSALNTFINHPNANLAKRHNIQLTFFSKKLKEEKFDGWFCSIENKTSVEVAILNNNNLFKPLKTELLHQNWNNGTIKNNNITLKNWGNKFSVCTVSQPAILQLNEKYKELLEEYIKHGINSKLPYEHVFQLILYNAIIYYHKSQNKEIRWN